MKWTQFFCKELFVPNRLHSQIGNYHTPHKSIVTKLVIRPERRWSQSNSILSLDLAGSDRIEYRDAPEIEVFPTKTYRI